MFTCLHRQERVKNVYVCMARLGYHIFFSLSHTYHTTSRLRIKPQAVKMFSGGKWQESSKLHIRIKLAYVVWACILRIFSFQVFITHSFHQKNWENMYTLFTYDYEKIFYQKCFGSQFSDSAYVRIRMCFPFDHLWNVMKYVCHWVVQIYASTFFHHTIWLLSHSIAAKIFMHNVSIIRIYTYTW